MNRSIRPINVFVSYSHKDKKWFRRLQPLLGGFPYPVEIAHIWHDHLLTPSDNWHEEILGALGAMDVFLCLVSYDFFDSEYIRTVELKEARKRLKQSLTLIMPLILYPMEERDLKKLDLKNIQPLPGLDRSWRDFAKGGDYRDANFPIRKGLLDMLAKVIEARSGKAASPSPKKRTAAVEKPTRRKP